MGPLNITAVRNGHSKFIRRLGVEIDEAQRDAGVYAQKHVHQRSNFKAGHPGEIGSIESSTKVVLIRTKRGNRLIIRNTSPHANPVEHGARPHIIRARNGKYLRFVVGGRVLFRRSVKHPGNKPTLFLYRAVHAAGADEYQNLLLRMYELARRF